MKLEDFPLVIWNGERLRIVPEIVHDDYNGDSGNDVCTMCRGSGENWRICNPDDGGLNSLLSSDKQCGDAQIIFLPEEKFEEYVVERVKVRIE